MTVLNRQRRSHLTDLANEYRRHLSSAKQYLLDRGISLEAAQAFGLGFIPDGPQAGRLAIPYWTPAGAVDIKARCMQAHDCKTGCGAKYLPVMAGNGQHLYNAQVLIQASDIAVMTEGELDAVCVQSYCGLPAVAFPGTESWKANNHWRLCFEGISEVIVIADGDEVGRGAAKKVADSIGMSARVVAMPANYDSNSYIADKGAQAFLDLLQR